MLEIYKGRYRIMLRHMTIPILIWIIYINLQYNYNRSIFLHFMAFKAELWNFVWSDLNFLNNGFCLKCSQK